MRLACDTGGTFTDLMVENDGGELKMYKAATTPHDPVQALLNAVAAAAEENTLSVADFLARCDLLIHGTTHAINAIVTGNTAKTAFLTTAGHPDVLVLREGGRQEPFNFLVPYPEPYVPRSLTFEIPERIISSGKVVTPLDESETLRILDKIKESGAEAVAVCFLWAIANPAHELRVAELIEQKLPGTPYTLAHRLNPALREYRRASAAAIDASLKLLMGDYLGSLTSRMAQAGFNGRTLVLTSQGGMMEAEELARAPIHAINSGPSMAPIAGRYYASLDSDLPSAIVADTGGTTYDVSLVRRGRIPKTRETWIGPQFRGHMTGFPSIDIKSIGAGGGSIATVDSGGMLHVGPESAGAVPGPVCYGAGGSEPTVTDACLILGYLDPAYFLGGKMKLDADAARQAVLTKIAEPLSLSLQEAAAAMVSVATETMVQAIAEITINQGIDPAEAVLIGGGGAAGVNSVWIARRLQCPTLIIPDTGATLSAAGALMSDLRDEVRELAFTTSQAWDGETVNAVLAGLVERCQAFAAQTDSADRAKIELGVEARYEGQVWEIDMPLRKSRFDSPDDLDELVADFHAHHEEIFAVRDEGSSVEFVCWTASVACPLRNSEPGRLQSQQGDHPAASMRRAYFADSGEIETPVYELFTLPCGETRQGPAIIESPFTSIVVDPQASYTYESSGSLIIKP